MLINLKTFHGFKVDALDGFSGYIHEFIFDETSKKVHGIVVNTGVFLMPDLHMIKPETVLKMDLTDGRFSVNLTKKEILFNPIVSMVKKKKNSIPVIWGGTYFPYGWYRTPVYYSYTGKNVNQDGSPLKNNRELKEYRIQTLYSGKVKFYDFILDTDSWNLKYLIMNLINRFKSKKKILITNDKVNRFDRNDSTIYLNMTQIILKFHILI